MSYLNILLVIIIVFVLVIGCGALIGGIAPAVAKPTPYPTPIPTPSDAQARALENRRAIEEAKAEQIRAQGDRERARAAADVERELGEAAARAIDRQGQLLTAYIVATQGRVFGVGLLVGVVLAVVAVAVAIEWKKVSGKTEKGEGGEMSTLREENQDRVE